MANSPTQKSFPDKDRHPYRPLLWRVLVRTFNGFFDHDVLSLSASLSFYTLLSFAPLLLLGVWLTSKVGYDVRQTLLDQIGQLAGSEARTTAAAVYASAHANAAGSPVDAGRAAPSHRAAPSPKQSLKKLVTF